MCAGALVLCVYKTAEGKIKLKKTVTTHKNTSDKTPEIDWIGPNCKNGKNKNTFDINCEEKNK